MVSKFQKYIASQNLLATGGKTLVATSGGVDSVVLCHLFLEAGLPFAMAHCNFQLRGEASDADEVFVKKLADEFRVDFYSTRFETSIFAQQNKLSTQQAARELRYNWLEETRQLADCQHIATAHHLDDSIETVFYNFAKGCGLRGLHGIPPVNGHVIRPLLFATKKDILEFAKQKEIGYREDASNLTDKYSRNLLRHHVVPVFEQINPSFQNKAGENIERLREAELLFDFALQKIMADVVDKLPDVWRIDLQKLLAYPAPATVLFEVLKPFGFNNDQVQNILQSADNQSGSVFYARYPLLVDRSFLILSFGEKAEGVLEFEVIPEGAIQLPDGAQLTFTSRSRLPDDLNAGPKTAWLDAAALKLPLRLRHWQPGDVFCPLGMGGKRQKLQDFFSNNKLSRFEKERVWLLESGGEIAWVLGWRMDERFKVSGATKNTLRLDYVN
jgi:tRNA(Ile)-lysidine synthase